MPLVLLLDINIMYRFAEQKKVAAYLISRDIEELYPECLTFCPTIFPSIASDLGQKFSSLNFWLIYGTKQQHRGSAPFNPNFFF